MSTSREALIKILNEKYPDLKLRTTEEFSGQTGGIWVSGTEDEIEAKDGFNLFDYYNEDYNETRYQFGVHKEIRKILEEHGWYGEWNDPGTMMIWKV